MKPPLSPSYKFEKEEGGEGLEEEEGEAAPPAMIPGSATDHGDLDYAANEKHQKSNSSLPNQDPTP